MGNPRINIGNVKFSPKDVQSYSVSFQDNGERVNQVKLKNGTTISFRDQDANKNSSVSVNKANLNDTNFFGIEGLCVEGSSKNDEYSLFNCENYKVDVRRGGQDKVSLIDSNNGQMLIDSSDVIDDSSIEIPNGNGPYIKMDPD